MGATAALADLQFPKWSTAGGPFSVRGLVTGAIGKAIEMPLTPTQAVGSSVCASMLLYGHQFQLFTTARALERRHARATKPGQTEITATLTFDFTPNELATKWLALPLVGCVNASAETIGGLLVYVNPPYWEERWRHGSRIHDTCAWTTHTAGNCAGVGWVTTHEEEIAEDGWPMGGRLRIARLGGWTNPSPGLFRRAYERRLGITEQSTLEPRVVAP